MVIHGKSGTGKELVAWTIHYLSTRKEKVFAPVNCGSEELSTTAEELASQAEMLQHTIAFFKTDEADRKTLADERHDLGAVHTKPRTMVAHIKDRKDTETNRTGGDGKPAGPVFEMDTNGSHGDKLDAEFERY